MPQFISPAAVVGQRVGKKQRLDLKVGGGHNARGWTKPRGGSEYSDASLRQFRSWLRDGLKHIKLPNGHILTKYEWIDEYLEQFEVQSTASQAAGELLEGLE